MKEIAQQIRAAVRDARTRLSRIDDPTAGAAPAPGKWSRKQVLGHLIDSAANNHHRFVRAVAGGADTFPAYDQNAWVDAQGYGEASWPGLIELWAAYNEHLCHVVERLPEQAHSAPCNVGTAEPVTLAFVVSDYLRHLNHHLDQLLASSEP